MMTDNIFNHFKYKYFNNANTKIFFSIGGKRVHTDEVVAIAYTYVGQHIPFYGYKSITYDAAPISRIIVQGQIVFNYTINGYIYNLLYGDIDSAIKADSTSDNNTNISTEEFFSDLSFERFKEARGLDDYMGSDFSKPGKDIRKMSLMDPFDIIIEDSTLEREIMDKFENIENDNIKYKPDDFKETTIIADVKLGSLISGRDVSSGVIKETYSFIGKTIK